MTGSFPFFRSFTLEHNRNEIARIVYDRFLKQKNVRKFAVLSTDS